MITDKDREHVRHILRALIHDAPLPDALTLGQRVELRRRLKVAVDAAAREFLTPIQERSP